MKYSGNGLRPINLELHDWLAQRLWSDILVSVTRDKSARG